MFVSLSFLYNLLIHFNRYIETSALLSVVSLLISVHKYIHVCPSCSFIVLILEILSFIASIFEYRIFSHILLLEQCLINFFVRKLSRFGVLYQNLIHNIICIYIIQILSSLYHFFLLFHLFYRSLDHFYMLYRSSPTLVPILQFLLLCQLLSHLHFLYLCISIFKCCNNPCSTVFRYIKTSSTFFRCFKAYLTTYVESRIEPLSFRNRCLVHFNLCINTSALSLVASLVAPFQSLYGCSSHFHQLYYGTYFYYCIDV